MFLLQNKSFILCFFVFFLVTTEAEENSPVSTQLSETIHISEQTPIQVYSAPLTPQEKLSQARIKAEQETEYKIRARLETMRLREEQKRLEQILTPLEDENVATQTPAPATSLAPSDPSYVDHSHVDHSHSPHSSGSKTKRGFFIQISISQLYYFLNRYPQISNSNFQSHNDYFEKLSLGLGAYFSRMSLEYSPYFSKYRLTYSESIYNNIKLRSHEVAAKFYFYQSGSIRAFIGVLGAFQNRTYQTDESVWNEQVERYSSGYSGFQRNIFTWQGRKSRTFQAGMTAGLETLLNQRIAIGGEIRGFINMYDLEDQWNQKYSYFYQIFPESRSPENWSWSRLQLYFRFIF